MTENDERPGDLMPVEAVALRIGRPARLVKWCALAERVRRYGPVDSPDDRDGWKMLLSLAEVEEYFRARGH